MIIGNIKPHWEVRYREVDSKTGETLQDAPVAITLDVSNALEIANALNLYRKHPKREYYINEVKELSNL